jgi:hypothetical protein
VPFRRLERALLRFRRMRNLQMFASVHAFVTNHFNQKRSLSSRPLFKANRAAYHCSDRTLFTLFFGGGAKSDDFHLDCWSKRTHFLTG